MSEAPSPSSLVVSRAPGLPAILPAKRNDWCTPGEVLEPCYEIFGGNPFGIDPSSNSNSIVRADHKFELPPGADITDLVGGLAEAWHEYGTFFVNPPFVREVIKLWVAKAIAEARLGAEGIMLLPAYVSAYFFDDIYRNADVICLWGKPGQSHSRVRFLGATDSATFPIMLVYFGPRTYVAASVLDRVGHIILPKQTRRWMATLRGDVLPELADVDERSLKDPLFSYAKHRVARRYDRLVSACANDESLSSLTLAEALASLQFGSHLGDLTVGEVAAGLAAFQERQQAEVERPSIVVKSRSRSRARAPSVAAKMVSAAPTENTSQSTLFAPSSRQARREEIDRQILAALQAEGGENGLLTSELRTKASCSASSLRTAMVRLCKRGLVLRTGKHINTRYFYHRHR